MREQAEEVSKGRNQPTMATETMQHTAGEGSAAVASEHGPGISDADSEAAEAGYTS